jgi:hypothetical protein
MSIFKKKSDGDVLVRKYDDDLEVNNGQLGNIQELFAEKDQTSGVAAIQEINSEKNIKMKSEVSKAMGESHYITKLSLLGDLLEINELHTYVHELLMTRVSNDRQGRRESVEISRQSTVQEQQKGFFRRMLG